MELARIVGYILLDPAMEVRTPAKEQP